ncbi:MAG: single-stranded-DNA-specific exonuclease RecJ [Acidobacteria bacterium]|nr:single-stranded-DNA-specific exonuclease RecJ [Acidobacteriota bacterium]
MRKPALWHIPKPDDPAIAALSRGLGIQAPAARVLVRRGYTDTESARRFLRPSIDDLINPYELAGMNEAAARLKLAIERKETVLLYGDYDVDGTCSVVTLTKAIELAGGRSRFYIPHRLKDGYGMRADVMDQAVSQGISLVISVDTGIRAADVVKHAATLGLDVIITDHHLPEEELPPALAVLNPNRPDCPYPDKNLCGAGVTFKLVQALMSQLGWPQQRVRRIEESFLKIVALATVADVVPLSGENRIIVKHGLAGFRKLNNTGLRALMQVSGFEDGKVPSAGDIAFRVAPRINAAGRMAEANDVIRLFLTADDTEAKTIATRLHGLNQERQETEAEIVAAILEECQRVPITDDQAALVFCGEGWHRGVLGIVASRLVERFCRPAFVLGQEDGKAQGSGRSIAPFHLLDALDSMRDVFLRYGGHAMAAGLTVDKHRVTEFRDRFNQYALQRLTPEDFRPHVDIDAVVSFHEVNDDSVAEILALAPFGAGNPSPLFAVLDATVCEEPVVFKEKHLRLRLRSNGRALTLKAWNFAERLEELRPGARVDAVVSFDEDLYSLSRGYSPWSVQLKDVRPAAAMETAPSMHPRTMRAPACLDG